MEQTTLFDQQQAERLVAQYSNMVLRIALHHVGRLADAEDIVQTVFLKLWRTRPTFAGETHERAWLIRVTLNACKDHYKTAWHRRVTPTETLPPSPPDPPSYEMLSLVQQLPPNHRTAIYLYYYENMPVAEIAQAMDAKQRTVMSWLHRGRSKLRELLKEAL